MSNIYKLIIPISNHDETKIHSQEIYFSCETPKSPSREQVIHAISKLYLREKNISDFSATIWNKCLKVISDIEDFPVISGNNIRKNWLVISKFGTHSLEVQYIAPIEIRE